MSRYGRDSNGGGSLGIYIVLAIVGCFVYSCCNSNERQATTDVANNAPVPDDGYYDEDGNYIENDSNLYEELNNEYKINYLGYNVDKSNYRDVEYEPYTHTIFVKTEGRVSFDDVITVDAPEGYEVDYCIPSENSNGQYGDIYGYINLKFTNTEKVVVREYYDTERKEYINASFGTPVQKEKVLTK